MNRFEIWAAEPNNLFSEDHLPRFPVVTVAVGEEDFVTIVPLFTYTGHVLSPTHSLLKGDEYWLVAKCELIATIPKSCLIKKLFTISEPYDRFCLQRAMAMHLGFPEEGLYTTWN